MCVPDDGWGYHPKHVEQFTDINKLCNVASCWIYIGIYLRYTDPLNVKCKTSYTYHFKTLYPNIIKQVTRSILEQVMRNI